MDHPPPKMNFVGWIVKCECHPDWIGPYIIHSELLLGERYLDITKRYVKQKGPKIAGTNIYHIDFKTSGFE